MHVQVKVFFLVHVMVQVHVHVHLQVHTELSFALSRFLCDYFFALDYVSQSHDFFACGLLTLETICSI